MKKERKSCILSADKSADGRPSVGGANVIAVLPISVDLNVDNTTLCGAAKSLFCKGEKQRCRSALILCRLIGTKSCCISLHS